MNEPQPLSVHYPLFGKLSELALEQIPVREVVAGLSQNSSISGKAGHQIHELLIDKDASLGFADALILQPPRPPGHDSLCLVTCTDA